MGRYETFCQLTLSSSAVPSVQTHKFTLPGCTPNSQTYWLPLNHAVSCTLCLWRRFGEYSSLSGRLQGGSDPRARHWDSACPISLQGRAGPFPCTGHQNPTPPHMSPHWRSPSVYPPQEGLLHCLSRPRTCPGASHQHPQVPDIMGVVLLASPCDSDC